MLAPSIDVDSLPPGTRSLARFITVLLAGRLSIKPFIATTRIYPSLREHPVVYNPRTLRLYIEWNTYHVLAEEAEPLVGGGLPGRSFIERKKLGYRTSTEYGTVLVLNVSRLVELSGRGHF